MLPFLYYICIIFILYLYYRFISKFTCASLLTFNGSSSAICLWDADGKAITIYPAIVFSAASSDNAVINVGSTILGGDGGGGDDDDDATVAKCVQKLI